MATPFSLATGAISTTPFLGPTFPSGTGPKSLQLYAFRSKNQPISTKISFSSSLPPDLPNDRNAPTTRRDLLIGIGGIYGTAAAATTSLAAPIQPPDLSKCGPASITAAGPTVECCPTFKAQEIIDFKFPSPHEPVRTRPAAHLLDKAYLRKYERAIQVMRDLPDDDPRSFKQQADVHCAYCNGSYDQVGFPDTGLQVHFSWIFFPFHRLYLYFFERILGKLIDDPTFALPYWNWDSPPGMNMPAIFTDPRSPLHDPIRNPTHSQPGYLLDLDWSREDVLVSPEEQIGSNLNVMYTQMVSGAKKRTLFFGAPLKAGDAAANTGQGSIERSPHMNVHIWTGDPKQAHTEDMGNFYSAGRDPIFYCHHANVDRMWDLWKTLGPKRTDFTDPDWLEAAFVFYDEDKNLVRCKVKDCLDSRKLNYDYQKVSIPWLETKRTPKAKKKTVASAFGTKEKVAKAATKKRELTPLSAFPLVLDKAISVVVPRTKRSRSKEEKEDEEEILVVEGIEFDRGSVVKFDVALNDEDDGGAPAGPRDTEFAGTFVNVPHREKVGTSSFKTVLRLGITDLMEDLDVDDDDRVVVTLVPKVGEVKIGGVKIDYITD